MNLSICENLGLLKNLFTFILFLIFCFFFLVFKSFFTNRIATIWFKQIDPFQSIFVKIIIAFPFNEMILAFVISQLINFFAACNLKCLNSHWKFDFISEYYPHFTFWILLTTNRSFTNMSHLFVSRFGLYKYC